MDPNPIKHIGSLTKRLRSDLEPTLLRAGFVFDGASSPFPQSKCLVYVRPEILLSITFNDHNGELVAEAINDKEVYRSVAVASLVVRTTPELMTRLNEFILTVREFVSNLPPAS